MKNRKVLVLVAPTLVALWFLNAFGFRDLADDIGTLGIYWPRRDWLHAHIIAGMVPLLLGPIQLWLGGNRQYSLAQRITVILYVMGVGVSGTAAVYLAYHTDFGFVVGLGFAVMAIVWLSSTMLSGIALWRGLIEQHREWMIRSYVVTFAAVMFQILYELFGLLGHGTIVEQMSAACWTSWSVPLIITEMVLQGRKIFAPLPKTERPKTQRESSRFIGLQLGVK